MKHEHDSRDAGPYAFGEKLLTLLEEGSFATTYKYAVLLALMDLCMENADVYGRAPTELATGEIARRIVEIYWPQTTIFPSEAAKVLAQSGKGQAEIVSLIVAFREGWASNRSAPISEARRRPRFQRLVDDIEWKLIEMPLPRLQKIGKTHDPFLYEISWTEAVKRRDAIDRRVRFRARSGEYLMQFAGLLRPLVQRKWAQMIAQLNRTVIEDAHIEDFLFGAERIPLVPLREGLRDLQDNRCFYCSKVLGARADVDHFLPWARHPDNAIENLVIADDRCNNAKRDFIAATDHVLRWSSERAGPSARYASQLADIARSKSWDTAPRRMRAIARAIYLRLASGTKLWREGRVFEDFDADGSRPLIEHALLPDKPTPLAASETLKAAEISPSYGEGDAD